MTRDQDFERELTAWLADGPSTAPAETVDAALSRIEERRQQHRLRAWLHLPLGVGAQAWSEGRQVVRLAVLLIVLVAVLLTMLVVSLPFAGGPAPLPTLDPGVVLEVRGSQTDVRSFELADAQATELELRLDDPRASGSARLVQHVDEAPGDGLQRSSGLLRIDNSDGAWQGQVGGARLPDGSELLYGWLSGEGAYAGFSLFINVHTTTAGPERAVEGVIWPGEPPPVPDPELLP